MTDTPLTEAELDAMQTRADERHSFRDWHNFYAADIPRLIAEIRRVRNAARDASIERDLND